MAVTCEECTFSFLPVVSVPNIKPGQQKSTLGPVGLIKKKKRKRIIQTYQYSEANLC